MVKLSKDKKSSAERMADEAIPGLKKRPSMLLLLWKKRSFMKKKKAEKRASFGRSQRPGGKGTIWGGSLDDILGALDRADRRNAAFEMQRTNRVSPASAPRDGNDELIFFSCDIHEAIGLDFTKTLKDCKHLVLQAGGTVMDECVYPGGFLYNFPAHIDFTNPLSNNEKTLAGGHINISQWKPLITKRLDPLRMNPPDRFMTPVTEASNEDEYNDEYDDDLTEVGTTPKQSMEECIPQKTEEAEEEGRELSLLTLRDDFDDELALSPRILDPGVELAILDPNLIRSGASFSRLSILKSGSRASWCEKEVYYPDGPPEDTEGEKKVDTDAKSTTSLVSSQRYSGVEATAVSARVVSPIPVRSFGDQVMGVEKVYSDFRLPEEESA